MLTAELAFERAIKAAGERRLIEPFSLHIQTEFAGLSVMRVEDIPMPKARVLQGTGNHLILGSNSRVATANITISGSNNVIFFGAECNANTSIVEILGNNCLYYFGAFSTVVSITIRLSGPNGVIIIGDDCLFSARIIVSNEDGHGIYDLASGIRINDNRDVLVDDHVWLGRDVMLNKGAFIGSDTIVGQGSIVSGTLPANSICAGVPAKPRRVGTTWSRWKFETLAKTISSSPYRKQQERMETIRRSM